VCFLFVVVAIAIPQCLVRILFYFIFLKIVRILNYVSSCVIKSLQIIDVEESFVSPVLICKTCILL